MQATQAQVNLLLHSDKYPFNRVIAAFREKFAAIPHGWDDPDLFKRRMSLKASATGSSMLSMPIISMDKLVPAVDMNINVLGKLSGFTGGGGWGFSSPRS
jgi:hypothetical protein